MFSCLCLDINPQGEMQHFSYTCVPAIWQLVYSQSQNIIKTELLVLSTSIKHQNIAKALLYYIYFLLMLTNIVMQEAVASNIQYADAAVIASLFSAN